MNIWNMDTRPSGQSLSLLEKGGAELPTCHLISRTSDLGLPLKRPLQNSKPISGFLLLDGESGLVSFRIWESSHRITAEFRLEGTSEVIWFIQLLKPESASKSDRVVQGFCPDKFWVTPWPYATQSLCAPLPAWPLSQCRIFFFTSNCNFLSCNLCLRQLKAAIRSPLA